MAKATYSGGQVTLVLNKEEALTLILLCERVGGDPEESPRESTDNILRELRKVAGIAKPYSLKYITGSITVSKNLRRDIESIELIKTSKNNSI